MCDNADPGHSSLFRQRLLTPYRQLGRVTGQRSSGAGEDGTLRIASVNLQDGGVSQDGTAARREQSAAALHGWQPHLILVQELYAPGEELVRRYFRALANATGTEPAALGLPRGSKRLRCGILADTITAEIVDDGPAPVRDAPFWAEAVVRIRATGTMLTITSVHARATTAAGQRAEAERLAARTAQRGGLAITAGDWNCYTPADNLTEDELKTLPPHLRPARTRRAGGRLAANYDVHDTLTSVGMADPVPVLPPGRRDPPDPPGTGSHPRARIDRFYLWPGKELLPRRDPLPPGTQPRKRPPDAHDQPRPRRAGPRVSARTPAVTAARKKECMP